MAAVSVVGVASRLDQGVVHTLLHHPPEVASPSLLGVVLQLGTPFLVALVGRSQAGWQVESYPVPLGALGPSGEVVAPLRSYSEGEVRLCPVDHSLYLLDGHHSLYLLVGHHSLYLMMEWGHWSNCLLEDLMEDLMHSLLGAGLGTRMGVLGWKVAPPRNPLKQVVVVDLLEDLPDAK